MYEHRLSLLDLKNPRLQFIYNNELEILVASFNDCKKTMDPKMFKFEILICFWLSVHMGKTEYAQYLCLEDPLIEKILENLRKMGRSYLIEVMARRYQERDRKGLGIKDQKQKLSIDHAMQMKFRQTLDQSRQSFYDT